MLWIVSPYNVRVWCFESVKRNEMFPPVWRSSTVNRRFCRGRLESKFQLTVRIVEHFRCIDAPYNRTRLQLTLMLCGCLINRRLPTSCGEDFPFVQPILQEYSSFAMSPVAILWHFCLIPPLAWSLCALATEAHRTSHFMPLFGFFLAQTQANMGYTVQFFKNYGMA